MSGDAELFPSEARLINDYIKEPLSPNIMEQEKQLRKGWELYLVDQWAHENPSEDAQIRRQQAENGEYAFTVARIKKTHLQKTPESYVVFHRKQSLFLLCLYVGWNLFFAYYVTKKLRKFSIKFGHG